MQRIIILGAGFAGLWAAIGAARARDEADISADKLEILVLDQNPYHSIRVRNYEADLSATCIPLASVLDPVSICHLKAKVTHIDPATRTVACQTDGTSRSIGYDRLVCALGSLLVRPPIPGLADHSFDVDTYTAAERLSTHIATLPSRAPAPGQYTALVIGAGLTGIEVAAEMLPKLRAAIAAQPSSAEHQKPKVILADLQDRIGAGMGDTAQPVIAEALSALGIETRTQVSLAGVDAKGGTLTTGEHIPAATIIWCAGMRAHPLAAQFDVPLDPLGRLPVDNSLRVKTVPDVFAAGDIAALAVDDAHYSVMSCQHSRPMGRYAGHNVVCDLVGRPTLDLRIPWYTTILDLGAWGAIHTEGWDRRVATTGAVAKRTKQIINQERIYPPRSSNRDALLAAAAPVIQAPPNRFT